MTSEWKETTLEDCTSLLGDGLHGTPQYTQNGEYAFVNGNNLVNGRIIIKSDTKRVNRTQFEKYKKELCDRTIMVSINGTLGNVALYNGEKIILGKSACYFNVLESVDKDFIRYVVSSPSFRTYLETTATGHTIKKISLKQMRDYSFYIPGYETQKRISGILRFIDDRISLNTAINENLESQAQAIFKSWFVDFEPFGGVMPEDWRTGSLSEICGYSKDKVNIEDLTLDTYYSTENMQPNRQGAVQATALPTIKQTIACKKGDVLISNIRPYFKKIIYCFADCGCSTDVLCFVPNKSEYSAFLYCALYSDKFFDYMVAGSKGTKMPRGDKQQIMMYPICIPSTEYVEQFIKIFAPVRETVYTNRLEANDLAILRDTLLPKLMKGEIDVSKVKI